MTLLLEENPINMPVQWMLLLSISSLTEKNLFFDTVQLFEENNVMQTEPSKEANMVLLKMMLWQPEV